MLRTGKKIIDNNLLRDLKMKMGKISLYSYV